VVSEHWEFGGEGAVKLAEAVIKASEMPHDFKFLYQLNASIKEKIETIAKEIYGARGVKFSERAKKEIKKIEKNKLDKVPVCIAKTQYSLTDDPKILGRPENFEITIQEVRLSNGAGFVVALAGEIMTMPGLPKVPAAEKIDVDEKGVIRGLF